MNLELRAKITEVNLGVVDINGFKYNKHKLQVQKLDSVDVLIPVYTDVCVGDCFVSTDWILTCLEPKQKPMEILLRVDKLELASPDDFTMSEYLNSKVTGLFCISDKCVLKTIGPDKVPFFNATLKVKNSFDESFDLFILAFRNTAKAMSTIKRQSIIECNVTVKRRKSGKGWEFPVSNIEIRSEGK